jgi:competence protein ComEA
VRAPRRFAVEPAQRCIVIASGPEPLGTDKVRSGPCIHKMEEVMLKKLLLAVSTMVMAMGIAFAEVDVNKADAAALDSVRGIGPAKSKLILEERGKGGEFKDWADFERRVKGIGEKNAMKLSEAGLEVNGKSKEGAKPMEGKQTAKAATAKNK